MKDNSALLIVDVQYDFCPGGVLQMQGSDRILPLINTAAAGFASLGLPVVATRDWHPAVSRHFRKFGGHWPEHCICNTPGARFHRDLALPPGAIVISKGTDPDFDGYSAFEGVDEQGRGLYELLTRLNVQHIYIAGLSTDYCVQFTASDALLRGFRVTVMIDAVAGIDAVPGVSQQVLRSLCISGARMETVDVILKHW